MKIHVLISQIVTVVCGVLVYLVSQCVQFYGTLISEAYILSQFTQELSRCKHIPESISCLKELIQAHHVNDGC